MCLSCWGYTFVVPRWKARRRLGSRSFQDYLLVSVTRPTVFLIRVLFDAILQTRTWDESARQFPPLIPLALVVEPSLDRIRSGRKSVTTSTTLRVNYHLKPREIAIVCICLRMQCYFITQAVDILYGTLRVRRLAYYGTKGQVCPTNNSRHSNLVAAAPGPPKNITNCPK